MYKVYQKYQIVTGKIIAIGELHHEVRINFGPVETVIIKILTKDNKSHCIKLAGLEITSKFIQLDISRNINITFLRKKAGQILAVDICHTMDE